MSSSGNPFSSAPVGLHQSSASPLHPSAHREGSSFGGSSSIPGAAGGATSLFQHGSAVAGLFPNGILGSGRMSRSRTPNPAPSQSGQSLADVDDDPRSAVFRQMYAATEARLDDLFADKSPEEEEANAQEQGLDAGDEMNVDQPSAIKSSTKKAARAIEEDDYDDDDDEEENENTNDISPLKNKSTGSTAIPRVASPSGKASPFALHRVASPSSKMSPVPHSPAHGGTSGLANQWPPSGPGKDQNQWQGKTANDARKQLEEGKKAEEEAARQSFHTMFYPLDSDRDAMLEQQRIEESERQADAEAAGQGDSAKSAPQPSTLSQTNLGGASLTLKHLIARIDAKRSAVKASDQLLRQLMVEVRKGRGKWASEDKIGQEELYEAADKVLSEIKGMGEHSQPFLARVNKRDAPDYYHIIKHPMDLSTMTKKLKTLQYKSKKEFVDDLNLIWANCLKYNASPEHFLRRHALFMRKETEKLVPLIPDIVIRDRAEVEAEERRKFATENGLEGAEDSDDEPIISSRGRKAPGKKAKKGASTARQVTEKSEGTPGPEGRLANGGMRADQIKMEDMSMDGINGIATPPPGTMTPAGPNGVGPSSQSDTMDLDRMSVPIPGVGGPPGIDYDDPEYKVWKNVTKKDRAQVASERHRLFKGDKLNPEEPALLRSKAGMRRWIKMQKQADGSTVLGKRKRDSATAGKPKREGESTPAEEEEEPEASGATLAEGMDVEEERVLPDYYDTMAAIPDLNQQLQWTEDSEGLVATASEETLRLVPGSFFRACDGPMVKRMDANTRQMQETRKIVNKIGVVKQMQLQTQIYQNQFAKYEPEPLSNSTFDDYVASDDLPIMPAGVCRAMMQRAVGKIFFAAGFEECQPSALEAATDLATDFFRNLAASFSVYLTQPRVTVEERATAKTGASANRMAGLQNEKPEYRSRLSLEESMLRSLADNGIELEALETYVTDDLDRFSNKLGSLHERMKAHLADILRPALADDAGPDGERAFKDGSEQFVGGDFAEDIDEDFFGFRELGLDKEFGIASLSVPLHLLQSRLTNQYRTQNPNGSNTDTATAFPAPPAFKPVTIASLPNEIGLVQNFFLAKLHANNDGALVEDEDLPQKQRPPKPRLPPTGKITSPRKRPAKEAGPGKGHPKKKMRLVDGVWIKESEALEREKKEKERQEAREAKKQLEQNGSGGANGSAALAPLNNVPSLPKVPGSKLKTVTMAEDDDRGEGGRGKLDKKKAKVNGVNDGGMISPESLEAS